MDGLHTFRTPMAADTASPCSLATRDPRMALGCDAACDSSGIELPLLHQAPGCASLRRAGVGAARGAAPAFGPLRPGCADARPLVDRTGGMSRAPDVRGLRSQTMPPAGDRPAPGWRGRRSRSRAHRGVRGEFPSRPPSTQAEPSRRGPWRPGRSYSGALHLDARNHARSTVCGSTADGMGAGESGWVEVAS